MRMKNKNAHKTGFIITNLTIKPVFYSKCGFVNIIDPLAKVMGE